MPKRRLHRPRVLLSISAVPVLFGGTWLAAGHQVPTNPTASDVAATSQLLGGVPPQSVAPRNFAEEVRLVRGIQDRVLAQVKHRLGTIPPIPEGESRELTDVLRKKEGWCYDRSRAIEMALRSIGLNVRHVSIYNVKDSHRFKTAALFDTNSRSHSGLEVKTSRGWMLVGTNRPWIGLTKDGKVIGIEDMEKYRHAEWSPVVGSAPDDPYLLPFAHIYGLYSRHGRFYPPFNALPDVNWRELTHNL